MQRKILFFIMLIIGIFMIGCVNVEDDSVSELPTPGASGEISLTNITATNVTLNWVKATDETSSAVNLGYRVYFSTNNNMEAVSDIEAFGMPVNSYENAIYTLIVPNLDANVCYYFNIIVRNENDFKSPYITKVLNRRTPIVGDSGLIAASSIADTTLTLTWTKATDEISAQTNLEYLVYCSTETNINTVAEMKLNGTAFGSYAKDIATKDVTGLSQSTVYYFNVMVKNENGYEMAYAKKSASTTPNWYPVGAAGFSNEVIYMLSMAISSTDIVYVAFVNNTSSAKVSVMKFNGISWEFVGAPKFSADGLSALSLALDSNDTPFVTYSYSANGNKATVMKFNGSWVPVGADGFSISSASGNCMAFDSADTPFVVYSGNDGSTVNQFTNNSWLIVGTSNFSDGSALGTTIAIDSTDTPFVAYLDGSINYKATVMKFEGTSWTNVGDKGFTAQYADYLKIALDSTNAPFVVYRDVDNSKYASVMKFNGTSWGNVGGAGFSSGEVAFTSLALDSADTVYVTFQDHANNYKATVMKYNGATWETVGSAGFSPGQANSTSIAIDSVGNKYVAYIDVANNSNATVMKFQ